MSDTWPQNRSGGPERDLARPSRTAPLPRCSVASHSRYCRDCPAGLRVAARDDAGEPRTWATGTPASTVRRVNAASSTDSVTLVGGVDG
jgi:hypothetical protein